MVGGPDQVKHAGSEKEQLDREHVQEVGRAHMQEVERLEVSLTRVIKSWGSRKIPRGERVNESLLIALYRKMPTEHRRNLGLKVFPVSDNIRLEKYLQGLVLYELKTQ